MRASATDIIGDIGETTVKLAFQKLKWGVADKPSAETGIDLIVLARDERGMDLRAMAAVQVKSGPSYFAKVNEDPDGWWYSETDTEHFDDWINAAVPTLIVLHDPGDDHCYWQAVTAPAVERPVGGRPRILVPRDRRVLPSQRVDLVAALLEPGDEASLEGSRWEADPTKFAPGDRMRAASVLPRMVAPHGNRLFGSVVEPEAVVAMLVDRRIRDVDRLVKASTENEATGIPGVPAYDAMAEHKDQRWQLVAATHSAVAEFNSAPLVKFAEDALRTPKKNPWWLAATAALAATVLRLDGDPRSAGQLLEKAIRVGGDHLQPVDLAWLQAVAASTLVAAGKEEQASEHAWAGLHLLRQVPASPTASALQSGCHQTLAVLSGWVTDSWREATARSDTAVSWWRSARLGPAFEASLSIAFKHWSDTNSTTWFAEDEALMATVSGAHNALLVGEGSTGQAYMKQLGRHLLAGQLGVQDAAATTRGLLALAEAGANQDVESACRRLWLSGPLEPLAQHVRGQAGRVERGSITPSALAALREAGDLLEEAMADEVVDKIVAAFEQRARFDGHSALRALGGTLPATSPRAHRVAADFLTELDLSSAAAELALRALTTWIDLAVLDERGTAAVEGWAVANQARTEAIHLLGRLAPMSRSAMQALLQTASDGSLDAFATLAQGALATSEQAALHIAAQSKAAAAVIEDAVSGSYAMTQYHPAAVVAWASVEFPEHADWSIVLETLRHPKVSRGVKHRVLTVLAPHRHEVPHELIELVAQGRLIDSSPDPFGVVGDASAPAGRLLAIHWNLLDEEQETAYIAELLRGEADTRAELARVLRPGEVAEHRGLVTALAHDKSVRVRAECASVLAELPREQHSTSMLRGSR